MIGSGEKMELSADIVNSGEDAFNAVLYLQIPRGINYISANTSNSQVSVFYMHAKMLQLYQTGIQKYAVSSSAN